jgi:fructose-1,6-bisphosphatase
MVKDTDIGKEIIETIRDLELLLAAYRQGIIVARATSH